MHLLALGPLALHGDHGEVAVGGPKPKALLTALVIHARQVVSVEQLIALVWDDVPPQSATALIHNYVSILRRSFAAVGGQDVLTTRTPGYLLNIAAEETDLGRFARHLESARQAKQLRQFDTAVQSYERALSLWRGPALGGVDSRFARSHAARLDEDRLRADEGLAGCLLAVGRAEEAASRLTRTVAENPLHEEARGLLMHSLYECGRQADALAVYQDGRRHLMDELGVEPGERLRRLQREILAGALQPLSPKPRTPPSNPARETTIEESKGNRTSTGSSSAPCQLPPDISDFTGRSASVDALLRLGAPDPASGRTATPIAVVSGFGGAGKSTLGIHAAHLLRESYPDGQLFADLRGRDHELDAHEVLRRFLVALGVAAADLPDSLDERAELYRWKVSGRRLVILLDNARSELQVRSLLPGNSQCLVIVTSRSRLTGLEGAESIELDFLGDDDGVAMFSRIIGEERASADAPATRSIVTLCGGVPLAIRTAAAKMLARPHWPLSALASRLSNERRRLDELAVGDLAIRSSLGLNYSELNSPQRRVFHLLALLDLPDFGAWLAAPLIETSIEDAEEIVEQLVDLRLLEVVGLDTLGRVRYRFHDLVRLFGAERAVEAEPHELVVTAVTRMLLTWMGLVEVAARQLPRVTLGLRPRIDVQSVLDPRLAVVAETRPTEWFGSETGTVVRVLERAHEFGIDEATTTFVASLLSSPFAARNEFDGWQRVNEVALASARSSGRKQAEAVVLAGAGQLFYEKDDFAAALEHFGQAGDLAEAVGDVETLAITLAGTGTVHRDRAEFDLAVRDLTKAAALAQEVGATDVLAAVRYGLGAIHCDCGRFDRAAGYFDSCVELYRVLQDKRGEALSIRGLSLCRRARGDLHEAVDLSRTAEELLVEAGDDLGAIYARQSFVKAAIRQGAKCGLDELLEANLSGCVQHGDRFGVALMTRTAGELALATGDQESARALLAEALVQWTELGLPLWQARTLRDLAAAEAGTPGQADEHWRNALALFSTTGARELTELAGETPQTWQARARRPYREAAYRNLIAPPQLPEGAV
ncbi:hypothetical protein AVR91_0208730 [Amycolatopsis keratiniphila subsp. keratiniphila]|uniref:OmpR/PhoB-type domain-containing protein n=2 Tax=Amycolatopsis keratiniphila TaxID=129921 RepID=A0A1W2LYI0_9PSEU|nr:hypothetical protein AVR91_0208730 [Amycolatopsis keratiniphila subsp. keratiniphila]